VRLSSFTRLNIHPSTLRLVLTSMRRSGAIGSFWPYRTGAMHNAGYGFLKINLLPDVG
jgi:hypothetical protein